MSSNGNRVWAEPAGGLGTPPDEPAPILIVDDDQLVLATLSSLLTRQGYRVIGAVSASAAMQAIRDEPEISVVVTDIDMPGRGGLDLADDLLANRDEARALEVVIVTGHPTTENAVRAVRGQIFDFLTKPLRAAQVGEAVRRAGASAWERRSRATRLAELSERMLAAEAEGERLRRADMAARSQLELALTNSDRLRAEILAVVSHELRTPLIPIIGLADILLRSREFKVETVRSYAETIHKSGRTLLGLVDGALEFLDSDRPLSASAKEAALEPIILSLLESLGDNSGVRVQFESVPDARVRAEPVRLARAIGAIIENAIKATPAEGGLISVRISAVEAGVLRIEITDEGEGISDKIIAGLGTPFLQDDMSATRGWTGAGMGLAIARRIIHRHGGELLVGRRDTGTGTLARILLPRAKVAQS